VWDIDQVMAGAATFSSWFIERDTENQSLTSVIWESGLRSWKKRLAQYRIKVRNGVYPAHLESLWIIMAIVFSLHRASLKMPYDAVNRIVEELPR
jgi:carnitine O-palmitoyltransferase 1, liver isoform